MVMRDAGVGADASVGADAGADAGQPGAAMGVRFTAVRARWTLLQCAASAKGIADP